MQQHYWGCEHCRARHCRAQRRSCRSATTAQRVGHCSTHQHWQRLEPCQLVHGQPVAPAHPVHGRTVTSCCPGQGQTVASCYPGQGQRATSSGALAGPCGAARRTSPSHGQRPRPAGPQWRGTRYWWAARRRRRQRAWRGTPARKNGATVCPQPCAPPLRAPPPPHTAM